MSLVIRRGAAWSYLPSPGSNDPSDERDWDRRAWNGSAVQLAFCLGDKLATGRNRLLVRSITED